MGLNNVIELSFNTNRNYFNRNASDGGIFHSTNDGNSWIKVYSGFQAPFIWAIALDGNKVYAGGGNTHTIIDNRTFKTEFINSVVVSSNYDSSWTIVLSPLDSVIMNNSKVDTISVLTSLYAKGSNILVGMKAYNFEQVPYSTPYASGGLLYHLVRNGDNWIIEDTSFTGRSIFAFESSGNDIYAATDTGVYRSTNYGSTWNDISSGMKNIYVSSLLKSDNYLYANTINGIWKRPLSEITSVNDGEGGKESSFNFSLSQNYPNPFNPNTTIKYTLGTNSSVTLKIYDILGREVQTLINENQTVGVHSIIFNAGNLSNGIYFYQLKVNNFIETKKLLLLR